MNIVQILMRMMQKIKKKERIKFMIYCESHK